MAPGYVIDFTAGWGFGEQQVGDYRRTSHVPSLPPALLNRHVYIGVVCERAGRSRNLRKAGPRNHHVIIWRLRLLILTSAAVYSVDLMGSHQCQVQLRLRGAADNVNCLRQSAAVALLPECDSPSGRWGGSYCRCRGDLASHRGLSRGCRYRRGSGDLLSASPASSADYLPAASAAPKRQRQGRSKRQPGNEPPRMFAR
jgi:hypothetical protein